MVTLVCFDGVVRLLLLGRDNRARILLLLLSAADAAETISFMIERRRRNNIYSIVSHKNIKISLPIHIISSDGY